LIAHPEKERNSIVQPTTGVIISFWAAAVPYTTRKARAGAGAGAIIYK
jgi:hypothetical protein